MPGTHKETSFTGIEPDRRLLLYFDTACSTVSLAITYGHGLSTANTFSDIDSIKVITRSRLIIVFFKEKPSFHIGIIYVLYVQAYISQAPFQFLLIFTVLC